MRYGKPALEVMMDNWRDKGLIPRGAHPFLQQYYTSTVGSIFDREMRRLARPPRQPELKVITSYANEA